MMLTQPRAAMRIVIQRRDGLKKRFVLVQPPFPEVGDVCMHDKSEWTVVKTQPTEALSIRFPKRRTAA